MPTLLHGARPKARKAHRCSCCAGRIELGEVYSRDTYVYDGRVYDWRTCDPCKVITGTVSAWWNGADEGITGETFAEWAHEHRDDAEHGEAARAYLARRGGAS